MDAFIQNGKTFPSTSVPAYHVLSYELYRILIMMLQFRCKSASRRLETSLRLALRA